MHYFKLRNKSTGETLFYDSLPFHLKQQGFEFVKPVSVDEVDARDIQIVEHDYMQSMFD